MQIRILRRKSKASSSFFQAIAVTEDAALSHKLQPFYSIDQASFKVDVESSEVIIHCSGSTTSRNWQNISLVPIKTNDPLVWGFVLAGEPPSHVPQKIMTAYACSFRFPLTDGLQKIFIRSKNNYLELNEMTDYPHRRRRELST